MKPRIKPLTSAEYKEILIANAESDRDWTPLIEAERFWREQVRDHASLPQDVNDGYCMYCLAWFAAPSHAKIVDKHKDTCAWRIAQQSL